MNYTKVYQLKPVNLIEYAISIHSKKAISYGKKFNGKIRLTFIYNNEVLNCVEISENSNIKSGSYSFELYSFLLPVKYIYKNVKLKIEYTKLDSFLTSIADDLEIHIHPGISK